jgi:hypothetical protein
LQFCGQFFDDFPQSVDLGVGLIQVVQTLLDPQLQVQVAAANVDRLTGSRITEIKKMVLFLKWLKMC